jgi:hypothetical protein
VLTGGFTVASGAGAGSYVVMVATNVPSDTTSAIFTVTTTPEVSTLAANSYEDRFFAAVIDAGNGFAYFGTLTTPGRIVKVRLSDFTEVGTLTLNPDEYSLYTAVIDVGNGFAYFGTLSFPGKVVKVRLSDFTEVATLTLDSTINGLTSAVIDTGNGFAYFGTARSTSPPKVVKVRLSDFTEVATLTLNPGEYDLGSAVIDTGNGFAYFGTCTDPGKVVKVRLSDFTEVPTLTLNSDEACLFSAVIDVGNGFAYFGTSPYPGKVVKVRLSDFTEVATLTLESGQYSLQSAVIDVGNGFAYFGTATSPGKIVKVRLSDFTEVATLTLNSGEANLFSAVIDTGKGFAYFGTNTVPGKVVKIDVSVAPVTPPTLALTPIQGPAGTVVTASAPGFTGTTCSLFSTPFGLFTSPSSCAISGGTLTGGFVVGASAPAGSYTVTVSTDKGEQVSATFTVAAPGTGYLSVNLDKWEYLTGLVVHISGDIYTPYCTWTYTNAGGLAVTLSISDSSGSVILTTTTDPTATGYKNYAYDFALPANAYSGTYTVLVSYNACGGPVYGHGAFQVISEPPHNFVVNVDRTSYVCGSNVLVTGKLWAAMGSDVMIPGATVIFEIHTPSGSVLASGSSTTDSLGIATFGFTLPSTCETGTYMVFASATFASIVYGAPDIHLTTSTNFTVTTTSVCTTITVPPWGVAVSTDKSVYGPADVVQITGSVSGGPSCYCPCGVTCTCTFAGNIIVELEIRNAIGTVVYSKVLTLSPYSSILPYSDSFSLSSALESGDYQVVARASYSGYPTVEARSSFRLEGTATTVVVTIPSTTFVTTTIATPVTTQIALTASTTVSTVVTVYTTVGTGATVTALARGLVMQVSSNSSVSDLVFDSSRNLLNFTVSGPAGTHGFFDAAIAKSLLLGQPVVLIDGVGHTASVTEDADFWYIHVTYPHSAHHVAIEGSNTIPEFSSFAMLTVIFVFAIIVFKRRTLYFTRGSIASLHSSS